MPDIVKTWPAMFPSAKVREIFNHDWGRFYFSLGRGRPSQPIERLWYTHRGRLIGYFHVDEIVQNAGQLPRLRSLSGEESEWQIKPDSWVAICPPPFRRVNGARIFYSGFRGWRYFDFEKYRNSVEAKVSI